VKSAVETLGPTRAKLTEDREVFLHDYGEDRIATGRRMIGEHRYRHTRGGHLKSAADQALGQQLAVIAPLERRAREAHADAARVGGDAVRARGQRL